MGRWSVLQCNQININVNGQLWVFEFETVSTHLFRPKASNACCLSRSFSLLLFVVVFAWNVKILSNSQADEARIGRKWSVKHLQTLHGDTDSSGERLSSWNEGEPKMPCAKNEWNSSDYMYQRIILCVSSSFLGDSSCSMGDEIIVKRARALAWKCWKRAKILPFLIFFFISLIFSTVDTLL